MLSSATLDQIPALRSIGPDRLSDLNVRPRLRRYDAGQMVFDRSDDSRDVCFPISGRLLCVFWTGEGRELVFTRIEPGSYLGQLSAIDNAPRSLTVYAQTVCQLVIVNQGDFLRLVDSVDSFRTAVLQDLVALIRQLTDRSYQISALSVDQRLRSYLAYIVAQTDDPDAPVPMPTHAEIANTIGTNREAVSRAISDLKKQGLIEPGRKSVRFLSREALLDGVFS
ncbi:MAG: Crp/Fnr family transcriptional regulator [Pseudomonadota bacterium]